MGQAYWNSLPAELACKRLEAPLDALAARRAAAIGGEAVLQDLMPVAHDQFAVRSMDGACVPKNAATIVPCPRGHHRPLTIPR
jgi:hypothetical protein